MSTKLITGLDKNKPAKPLSEVFKLCARCGHGRNMHESHCAEPHCIHIDSDGPCSCEEFE